MNQTDTIPVFYCFARSGGTLLNQCLGVTPGNLVLSEVNPHVSCRSVEQQAQEWLGLITVEEKTAFSALEYGQKIHELLGRARHRGEHLILRDWCTVNFLARTAAPEIEPSGVLEQPVYLAAAGLTARAVAFTRRAASVYASIRENFHHLQVLPLDTFAEAYLGYARAITGVPCYKLEEFTVNPVPVMQAIAASLGVPLNPDFQSRYREYQNCTGNNLIWPPPLSLQADSINPRIESRRQSCGPAKADHPKLREADRLLGYEIRND